MGEFKSKKECTICYRDILFDEISIIREVWERNRKYHEEISKNFKYIYCDMIFEDRIKGFSYFNKDHIKITVAEDINSDKLLGYCISTFEENQGQPQTLHVIEEARGRGIGKELMNSHIGWLKDNGCKSITITVSYENINTINFYKNLGFEPNTIEMRIKEN